MVNEKIIDTTGRSLQTAYFLDEGLFEEVPGTSIKGSGSIMVNVAADAGKMITCGSLVKFSTSKDNTVVKCTDNDYDGFIVTDPVGAPPTAAGMPLREATMAHIAPGNKYHLKLKDNNATVTPGKYIVANNGEFDASNTKVNGVVLKALESASANSGKFIDVYCEQIKYVGP